mmetsp:Transcript_48324/g.137255  ORF Transcript_48324/g.137255 Transcript_48324/m.137255 type:complete len:240 (-) Transcript_48324:407-1126(-)
MAPCTMGTTTVGSVACAASSTNTRGKVYSCSRPAPAPTEVQQTTSASSITFWSASLALNRSEHSFSVVKPNDRAALASAVCSKREAWAFSGWPNRTAFTPARINPSSMLSTAMFESLVASKHDRFRGFFHVLAQSFRICTHVAVLPVPGGPCTNETAWLIAAVAASTWLGFKVPPFLASNAETSAGTPGFLLTSPAGSTQACRTDRAGRWTAINRCCSLSSLAHLSSSERQCNAAIILV